MNSALDWNILVQVGAFLAAVLLGWLLGSLARRRLSRAANRALGNTVSRNQAFWLGLGSLLGSAGPALLTFGLGLLAQVILNALSYPTSLLHWLLPFLLFVAVYQLTGALVRRQFPLEQASGLDQYLLRPLLAGALVIYALGWLDDLLAVSVQPGQNEPISLRSLLVSGLLFYLFFVAARTIRSYLRDQLLPKAGVNPALAQVSSRLVFYALLTLGLLISLTALGIDLTALTVVAGGLSVGVGLGLQALFNNFVSGFLLMLEHTIVPGDVVRVADQTGTVKDIRLRSMIIRTLDDVDLIIPNGKVLEGPVINYSRGDARRRVAIRVSVAAQSDPRQVEALLLQALLHPLVLIDPAPAVYLSDMKENTLDFDLYAYTSEPDKTLRLGSDLRFRIMELFREHGIELHSTMRDVFGLAPTLPAEGEKRAGPAAGSQ